MKRLRSAAYDQYLLSNRWRLLRIRVIWRDRAQCQSCGGRISLEVHHKTYVRLGNERLDDLVTLCKGCHRDIHAVRG